MICPPPPRNFLQTQSFDWRQRDLNPEISLLEMQLLEWIEIEEQEEANPEVVIDLWEMNKDMDDFQDKCDQKEELLATQARSYPPSGMYLVPKNGSEGEGSVKEVFGEVLVNSPFCDVIWKGEERIEFIPPGIFHNSTQLLAGDKMMVKAVVKKKGNNFLSASSDKGDIYIDLKYTKYVPDVGKDIWMIARLKEVDRSFPLQCVKIIPH